METNINAQVSKQSQIDRQRQQQINNAIIAQRVQAAQHTTITTRAQATVEDHVEQNKKRSPVRTTVAVNSFRRFGRL